MRRSVSWFRHSNERRLGQYWDEVVSRAPATPVPFRDSPTEPSATIRAIHSLDELEERSAPFADRQLQMLLARHREMNMNASVNNLIVGSLPNAHRGGQSLGRGESSSSATDLGHERDRWWLTGAFRPIPVALLAALLVAAALLVDWYTSPRNDNQSNPAIIAPDVATPGASPPTSEQGVEAELFTATFAAADLPSGEVDAIFYRLTLDIGVTMTQLAGPYCGCPGESLLSGVGVETVVSGSYQLRSDAQMRIRRAGSDVEEEVPAGTEISLGPGDSVVHLDYAAAGEFQSAGSEAVVVIGVAIVEGESAVGTPVPPLPDGARAEQLSRAISRDWEKVAPGPVTASLRRTLLAPGESWPADEPSGLETIHIESGQIDFALIPAGQEEPTTLPLRHAEGRTTLFSALGPGVRRSIENTGDVTATLLVLTIVPGSSDPGTPETG